MKATELNLSGPARAAAALLEQQHPEVVFTSGRRGVADQARAMASNLVANRHWIAQTYVPTAERAALQHWVDTHPQATTQAQIAAGLASVMTPWTDAQRGRVSKHFSGEAFDVQPIHGPTRDTVLAAIRALPGLKKFLDREGGLERWHAQFS